jgi:hypothetical protein
MGERMEVLDALSLHTNLTLSLCLAVLDVLSHARWWAWKLNLVLVTILLILVVPYCFFYLMLRNHEWPWHQASYLAAPPLALYLWVSNTITNSLPAHLILLYSFFSSFFRLAWGPHTNTMHVSSYLMLL